MPQQSPQASVVNNFNQGFKTEFTGLNFPENASTDTQNCVFNRIGNVTRRPGINYETNFQFASIDRTLRAINTYRWKNVGGDGLTQIIVTQVGETLRFYKSSSATIAAPLSATIIAPLITLPGFTASGGTFDATAECQFADGNGYLFVFHPSCEPFYCTYNAGLVTATAITIQVRDFIGIDENVADNNRPVALTTDHNYNLYNQGWAGSNLTGTPGNPSWSGYDGTTVQAYQNGVDLTWTAFTGGLPIIVGEAVTFSGSSLVSPNPTIAGTATVSSYSGNTLVIHSTSISSGFPYIGQGFKNITVSYPGSAGTTALTNINKFKTDTTFYPSNSDVWWLFKNASGVFDPATTKANVVLPSSPAAKGAIILQAFNQQRTLITGLASIPNLTTTVRPRTGTFFQGRAWYAGTDAAISANPEFPYYTWTENIYFSQIVQKPSQLGYCYQTNDPTAETLFDLLPTDGGVITIQGTGSIYKLFPIHNGLLVFAANGVWLITGSTGIGFAANDYTISKISAIQSISGSSFIDVRGMPMWWNEEGIYNLVTGDSSQSSNPNYGAGRGSAASGGLSVEPITYTTIQSFYQDIPLSSKKYVKGTYDALNWEVKWVYRSTESATVTERYQFDSILTLNTMTQAFSPWVLPTSTGVPYISGIEYVQGPGGSTSPDPTIKYLCSTSTSTSTAFTFAEENDTTTYTDWASSAAGVNFSSYFVTGYRLKGQAKHKFQTEYIFLFSDNSVDSAYRFQGIWAYARSGDSGKYTPLNRTDITGSTANFSNVVHRHRLPGRGLVNQFRIQSVDGEPFNIIGWTADDKVNTGV